MSNILRCRSRSPRRANSGPLLPDLVPNDLLSSQAFALAGLDQYWKTAMSMADEMEEKMKSREEKEDPLSDFFYLLSQVYPNRLCAKRTEDFQYLFRICDPKGKEGTMREKERKYNVSICIYTNQPPA